MNHGNKHAPRRQALTSAGSLWPLLLCTLLACALCGCSDDTAGTAPQTPFPDPDVIPWIFAIWGDADSGEVFMVGRPGFILHYDGTTWTRTDVAASSLTAVWGTGPNDVYACGHGGVILHYNGASWSSMTSGTDQNLYDIGEGPYGDLYTVGYDGTLKKLSGGSWDSSQRRAFRGYPATGEAPEDTLVFRDSIDYLTVVTTYGLAGNSSIVLMENDHVGFESHEWEWGPVEDDDFSLLTAAHGSDTLADNYLATDTGKILRLTTTLDGNQWVQLRNNQGTPVYPSTYPERVTSLWLDDDADLIYMTTWNGFISTMEQDGSDTETVYTGSGWLSAVWGTDSTNIYVAGYGGVVLRFDGNNWAPVDVPLPDTTAKTAPATDKFGRPLF